MPTEDRAGRPSPRGGSLRRSLRRRKPDAGGATGPATGADAGAGAAASAGGSAGGNVVIRALTRDDLPVAEALLAETVAGRRQLRLGAEVDALAYPGFGAWQGTDLIGLATWTEGRPRAELVVLALAASHRGRGIGAALVEWVAAAGRKHGTHELWLVTTNDNLDALRLYQRHAFRLAELRAGAMDLAREAKPAISRVGAYGIPLRDELVLKRRL